MRLTLVEQGSIGNFIGESMLEGILQLGKKLALIQKFGGLKCAKYWRSFSSGTSATARSKGKGTTTPMTDAV